MAPILPRRLTLALCALALLPLSTGATAPPTHLGTGASGWVYWDDIGTELACADNALRVTIVDQPTRRKGARLTWLEGPMSQDEDRRCSFPQGDPVLHVFGTAADGYRLDRPDNCGRLTLDVGPLGPETSFSYRMDYRACGPPGEGLAFMFILNGTLAFV